VTAEQPRTNGNTYPGRGSRCQVETKGIVGTGFLVIALGLAIAGTILPWWAMTTTYASTPPEISTLSTYLSGFTHYSSNDPTSSQSCPFAGIPNPENSCPALSHTATLYAAAFASAIAGIALLACTLGLLRVSRLLRRARRLRSTLSYAFPFIAAALLLLSYGIVGPEQGAAFRSDSTGGNSGFVSVEWTCNTTPDLSFAGYCGASHISFQWGPGSGWIATVASGVCALAAAVFLMALQRRHGAVLRSRVGGGSRGSPPP
jgi:hypothetical protein